jgi:hypothetical protein
LTLEILILYQFIVWIRDGGRRVGRAMAPSPKIFLKIKKLSNVTYHLFVLFLSLKIDVALKITIGLKSLKKKKKKNLS